jgi:bisphosphoglycerate-dependent phosphoglycerate mutase
MRFQADAVRNYGRLQGAKENNMNEDYPTKTTVSERKSAPKEPTTLCCL